MVWWRRMTAMYISSLYTTIDVSYIAKYLHQYDLQYILIRNNRCQLHQKVPIRARIANGTRELNVTHVATYATHCTKYVNIFISVHLDDQPRKIWVNRPAIRITTLFPSSRLTLHSFSDLIWRWTFKFFRNSSAYLLKHTVPHSRIT